MKIHLPNSAFLGNIDPFLRTLDVTNPNKLEITTNEKWISIHPVVLSMVAAVGLTIDSSKINFEKLKIKIRSAYLQKCDNQERLRLVEARKLVRRSGYF